MLPDKDATAAIAEKVKAAIESRQPLYIHGGNSKRVYANWNDRLETATPLSMAAHSGIINYEPSELAVTVRAGTRLSDLESLLAEQGQILPFEPPAYNPDATIGGAVAAGIAGPRAPYSGTIRDAILGVRIINGHGEIARFGGEVMKNVAGYDISRLMAKSWGTLGAILDVSLRLLPKPESEKTVFVETSQQDALDLFQTMRKQQQPVSASAWFANRCAIRFAGTHNTVQQALDQTDAALMDDDQSFWRSLRDHQHHFFDSISQSGTSQKALVKHGKPLWKIALPPATSVINGIDDKLLIEWGGMQRWIYTNTPANILNGLAAKHQGYATLISSNLPDQARFSRLEPVLLKLHKQLKRKMDPHSIFNPGRLYEDL